MCFMCSLINAVNVLLMRLSGKVRHMDPVSMATTDARASYRRAMDACWNVSLCILQYRAFIVKHNDHRIKLTNEALQSMRAIKLYCWEQGFMSMVSEVRHQPYLLSLLSLADMLS